MAITPELCMGCKAVRSKVCQRTVVETQLSQAEFNITSLKKAITEPHNADFIEKMRTRITTSEGIRDRAQSQLETIAQFCTQSASKKK